MFSALRTSSQPEPCVAFWGGNGGKGAQRDLQAFTQELFGIVTDVLF